MKFAASSHCHSSCSMAIRRRRRESVDLKVGDAAPEFSAKTDAGETWNSDDHADKTVVVYFYPAAMTGGCTKQACAYRDDSRNWPTRVEVVGVERRKSKASRSSRKPSRSTSRCSPIPMAPWRRSSACRSPKGARSSAKSMAKNTRSSAAFGEALDIRRQGRQSRLQKHRGRRRRRQQSGRGVSGDRDKGLVNGRRCSLRSSRGSGRSSG